MRVIKSTYISELNIYIHLGNWDTIHNKTFDHSVAHYK